MILDFLFFLAKLASASFAVYLAARLASAAFFKSKYHYEREKHHD
jgi:hypothetical protein